MPNENNEGFIVEAKANIDQSFENLLTMMQSMANTGLDITSSLSESAQALAGFAQQATNASYQLEKLARAKYSIRAQVMLVTGVFTGAATAIYKFVKSTAEAEMGLAKLAKQQKQTVETARASQTALETMGKTLKEVKSDKELKKTYDELVKINAEMALPKMDRAIENVKGLRNAFWQLRDTAKYAIDWIGARVLINLEEPIKRITGKFSEVAKWLRFNLDSVTMKISSGITAFVKGIEGVVEGFGKVIEQIGQIDPAIRKIGGAILFLMALLKSGPLGMLLTLITAIGGLIDDAENFKYNQAHNLTKESPYSDANGNSITKEEYEKLKRSGKDAYEYVDVAFKGAWESLFAENGTLDFGKMSEKLMEKITEGMKNFSNSDAAKGLIGDIFGGADGNGGLLGQIRSWFDEHKEGVAELGESIVNFISSSITAFAGPTGGFMGQILNLLLGDGTIDESITSGGTEGATFAATLGGAIGGFIKGLKEDKGFLAAVVEGAGTGAFAGLLTSILTSIGENENGELTIDFSGAGAAFKTAAKSIVSSLKEAISLSNSK